MHVVKLFFNIYIYFNGQKNEFGIFASAAIPVPLYIACNEMHV